MMTITMQCTVHLPHFLRSTLIKNGIFSIMYICNEDIQPNNTLYIQYDQIEPFTKIIKIHHFHQNERDLSVLFAPNFQTLWFLQYVHMYELTIKLRKISSIRKTIFLEECVNLPLSSFTMAFLLLAHFNNPEFFIVCQKQMKKIHIIRLSLV